MSRAWPAIAAALAVTGTVEALLLDPAPGPAAGVLGALALATSVLAVPGRPRAGSVLVLAAALVCALTDAHPGDGLTPVAVVMLVAVGVGRGVAPDRAGVAWSAALGVVALGTLVILYREPDPSLRGLPFFCAFLGASYALGGQLRGRALERDDLQERRRALEEERAAQVAGAVARERSRIAAELHAIIASSVDRVADGARRADEELDRDPQVAVATLRDVRAAARAALTETRRLLGVLRAEQAAYAPQPGLASLTGRGFAVQVAPALTAAPLPTGLELALVRLVEDAVAAVGPERRAAVVVTIDPDPGGVRFVVAAGGDASPWPGGDPVLAAMHERARLYGGRVAPTSDSGRWALHGHLPVAADPT